MSTLEGYTLEVKEAKEMTARLKAAEDMQLTVNKHCTGDASETGLVQFVQAIMDLNETRNACPTFVYQHNALSLSKKEVVCKIPFSSDIKFNCFIRKKTANQHSLYLKGAPERVLTRCTKILINNKEVPLTDELL